MRRHVIGIGGTFDHFHLGHHIFLKFAANQGTELVVGVTDQKLTQSKPLASLIQPLAIRKKQVGKFLDKLGCNFTVVTLTDQYGPAITNQIHELVVTEETQQGAAQINTLREKLNLRSLPIAVAPWAYDQSGQLISSTRIRRGQINTKGIIFQTAFKTDLKLTELQRTFFARPQGNLAKEPTISELPTPLRIVVGDASLEHFLQKKWGFDIAIFDNHEQRTPTDHRLTPTLKLTQPAGQIITDNVIRFSSLIDQTLHHKKKHLIQVDGEEDLFAVLAVLLAPLYSRIYYGQPNQGQVEVIATLEVKNRFFDQLTT